MLFRRNIKPSCGYCHYGIQIGFGDVACIKRGIMTVEGRCNAFRYEPTKREPEFARTPKVKKMSEQDLAL